MDKHQDELLDDLNLLFARNHDAIRGYKHAAKKLKREELSNA